MNNLPGAIFDRLSASWHSLEGRLCRFDILLIVLGVFFGHLFWRWSVLDAPPYWDALVGPFTEAVWLVEHGFNYHALVTEQGCYAVGGAAVYVDSILPTVIALAYVLFGEPTRVFVSLHLLNFVLASVLTGGAYWIVNRHLGFSRKVALLFVAGLLLTPLLGGQIDSMSMEVPVATAMVLAASAFLARRWWSTLFFTLLALFTKESCMIQVMVQAVLGGYLFCFASLTRRERVALFCASVIPTSTYIAVRVAMALMPELSQPAQPIGWMVNGQTFRLTYKYCFPEQFILSWVMLGLSLLIGCYAAFRKWKDADRCLLPVFRQLAASRSAMAHLYCGLIALLFVNFQFNYELFLPRYLVWYLFFFVLLYLLTLHHLGMPRYGIMAFFVVYAVWGGMNQFGAFRPPLPRQLACSGEYLERSREYIKDLRVTQEMCRFIEANCSGRNIVCDMPVDHMLTKPKMGYVEHPLQGVYTTSRFEVRHAPITWFLELTHSEYDQAVFVYRATTFQSLNPRSYAPKAQFNILWKNRDGNALSTVFELIQPGEEPATE